MAHALLINPKKRTGRKMAKRKTYPAARKAVSRRRNPARRKGIVDNTLMPAAIAGAGAVGANLAFDYLAKFLPPEWAQGNMRFVAEAGMIIVGGMALDKAKLGDKKLREGFVTGALGVTAYRAFDQMLANTGILNGYTRLNGYQPVGMGYQSNAVAMRR